MRVFLDECVDWRLARHLTGHDVKSARQMGWTTLRNGELLARAAAHFDVFLTVDANLSYQQNMPQVGLAVIVVRAKTNRLADIVPLTPDILTAISAATAGHITTVGGV